ncbi:hypothetical protein T265_06202 [Opisthorchis viverrini]|uniref:Uncharacterized protein n=1 Tax=Opisthorchis viverrini TaxID=6198 RepID=A0A074ZH72_OPIVI|nr:hypothetical protein T265_06202 [Opisthorchis viverrini]KER26558.1 hypothetical protein T265_06202 [Opisthorchis viverrini]
MALNHRLEESFRLCSVCLPPSACGDCLRPQPTAALTPSKTIFYDALDTLSLGKSPDGGNVFSPQCDCYTCSVVVRGLVKSGSSCSLRLRSLRARVCVCRLVRFPYMSVRLRSFTECVPRRPPHVSFGAIFGISQYIFIKETTHKAGPDRRKSTCAESDAPPRSPSVRHVRKVGESPAPTKHGLATDDQRSGPESVHYRSTTIGCIERTRSQESQLNLSFMIFLD